jgi:hypothetical protein
VTTPFATCDETEMRRRERCSQLCTASWFFHCCHAAEFPFRRTVSQIYLPTWILQVHVSFFVFYLCI